MSRVNGKYEGETTDQNGDKSDWIDSSETAGKRWHGKKDGRGISNL